MFVVVAWVSGTNLRQYLDAIRRKSTPRPSVSEVVRLIRGLVHGVSHYHRKANLVHGDISPANILLSSGTTQLVLIDFGSAWPIESVATKDDGDGVTQPYAAPERMAGHAAEDFRSDMFSLSAVAYELLTLKLPFGGLGGRAGLPSMPDKLADSYQRPSKLARVDRLPRRNINLLDDCVGRGLSLHPDERFATSQDWLAAWDQLHFAMKKGTRLNGIESMIVDKIAAVCRLFGRSSSD